MNNSFHLLNQSIVNDDFDYLYNKVAKIWQLDISTSELEEKFQNFIDEEVELTEIIKSEIVFSNDPYISKEYKLVLEGYYINQPVIYFDLVYTYEYPEWRLVEFKTYTK